MSALLGTGSSCLPTHLCRLHVVFGHVVSGVEYVTEVENQKVDSNHRPYADVRVSNCGELVLMKSKPMACAVHWYIPYGFVTRTLLFSMEIYISWYTAVLW